MVQSWWMVENQEEIKIMDEKMQIIKKEWQKPQLELNLLSRDTNAGMYLGGDGGTQMSETAFS